MCNVCVVAFDGLDYELIKKYGCNELTNVQEFGKIDNHTNIPSIKTCPEFVSFITGELPEKTGIKNMKVWTNPLVSRVESTIKKLPLSHKTSGLRNAIWESIRGLGADHRIVVNEDYNTKTLFDKIPSSKALNLPGYNEKTFLESYWKIASVFGIEEQKKIADKEFEYRKREFFDELNRDYNFLMAHFHKPDIYHHLFWETERKKKVQEMYEEINKLARDIKQKATYNHIIFMSDHGLPTEKEHNKNAFYSYNGELFDGKPHIIDFHDKILELSECKTKKRRKINI